MEVLVVGNTAYVDDDFCAKAFPGDHVKVVAAQEARRDESSPHASWKELLQHLEQAYEFDRVVYLSNYLTPHTDTVGDIELLRSVFRTCAGRRIQLLYIAGPAGAEVPPMRGANGQGIIAHAANDLCRYYAAREGVQTKILRVPFLYTASAALEDPFLVPLFDACSTGSAALQGAQDAAFPLLCAEELSVLVRRIFDSWDATLRRSTLPIPSITRWVRWARPFSRCSQGSQLPMAILPATPCLPATSLACAMAGFSVTTCCATSRPFRLAGMLVAQRRSTPCARPSTAFKCARCLSIAWRRQPPGCSLKCWSACSPNRPAQRARLSPALRGAHRHAVWLGLWPGCGAAGVGGFGRELLYSVRLYLPGPFLRAVQLAAVYCVLCCGCRVRLCAAAQQRSH